MLNFQDFSKFLKILKSTVQYLSRDISNVKSDNFYGRAAKNTEKPFLALQPSKSKKSKIRHTIPQVFSIPFQSKKNF